MLNSISQHVYIENLNYSSLIFTKESWIIKNTSVVWVGFVIDKIKIWNDHHLWSSPYIILMSDEVFKCPWPSCITSELYAHSTQNRYHQCQNGDE